MTPFGFKKPDHYQDAHRQRGFDEEEHHDNDGEEEFADCATSSLSLRNATVFFVCRQKADMCVCLVDAGAE
jgi:hypothetical protein